MDELLFAITERFNPLCTGQTLMMNRERIPQTDGLKCKPCLNIDFTTSCCCNCFRVASVGAFLSDVVTRELHLVLHWRRTGQHQRTHTPCHKRG